MPFFSKFSWLGLAVVFICVGSTTLLAADLEYQDRHIMLLDSGLDSIYGSYWFGVRNLTQTPQTLRIPLMVPQETADWQVQDGITKDDVKLADDGRLMIDKAFPPGETMVSIGFMVHASLGQAQMSFMPAFQVRDLQILVPSGTLTVHSDQMAAGKEITFSGRMFQRIAASDIEAGKPLHVIVEGIPEGRGRFWLAGGVVAAFLVLIGFGMAWRTKPRTGLDEAQI